MGNDYKTLLVEKQDNIAIVTLNRPDKLNTLSGEMWEELHDCFFKIGDDLETRVVILRGAGRAFCAGLDLSEGFKVPDGVKVGRYQYLYQKNRRLYSDIVVQMRQCPQPIIGAIRGAAAGGGCNLALACDIRIAGESARFGLAYVKIGYSGGDMGSSYFLPRIIGFSRAAEYMYTGRFMDATTAEKFGLVSKVVKDDNVDEAALELAREIIQNSPLAIRLTKEGLNFSVDASSLDSVIEVENRANTMCTLGEDFQEGMKAAIERRPARWRDH